MHAPPALVELDTLVADEYCVDPHVYSDEDEILHADPDPVAGDVGAPVVLEPPVPVHASDVPIDVS